MNASLSFVAVNGATPAEAAAAQAAIARIETAGSRLQPGEASQGVKIGDFHVTFTFDQQGSNDLAATVQSFAAMSHAMRGVGLSSEEVAELFKRTRRWSRMAE